VWPRSRTTTWGVRASPAVREGSCPPIRLPSPRTARAAPS
jgi:hypothetical protein